MLGVRTLTYLFGGRDSIHNSLFIDLMGDVVLGEGPTQVTQQLKVVPPPGRDDNRVSKLQLAKSSLLPVFAKLCWNTARSFIYVLSLAAFTL